MGRRLLTLLLAAGTLALADAARAEPVPWPTLPRREGTFDLNTTFTGFFGKVKPTPRESTWQTANVKLVDIGAGYAIGRLGPFHDCYVRVDGGYFTAHEEAVESPVDDLRAGHLFYPQDRGGFVRGYLSTNLIKRPRYGFGLFLQGTAPIKVDLAKFSSAHFHWVGGGTTLEVALTDPNELLHLHYSARFFVGSGAYSDEGQHNAQVQLTNLLRLEASRWLLPYRIGLMVGPHFEGDINKHVNPAYHNAYDSISPDLVNGDEVRSMAFALAVLPYIHVTRHAALELGYQHTLFGAYLQHTQQWTGGFRSSF
jgi:hypothetical protein